MENYVVLIHKANTSHLPTNLPAQFFGMPDGKVIIIYARLYDICFDDFGVEFVLAEHQDFSFNYSKRTIVPIKSKTTGPIKKELIDKPNPAFTIKEVWRNINSFAKAYEKLNLAAKRYIDKHQMVHAG